MCGSVAKPLRRRDGAQIAAGDDTPAVVMDFVMAFPAQQDQIVDVGRAATRQRHYVMGVTEPVVSAAPSATSVTGHQRSLLSVGHGRFAMTLPQRHPFRAENGAAVVGVAHVLLEHALRNGVAAGDLGEGSIPFSSEMLHDGDVSRHPATRAGGATDSSATRATSSAGDASNAATRATDSSATRAGDAFDAGASFAPA